MALCVLPDILALSAPMEPLLSSTSLLSLLVASPALSISALPTSKQVAQLTFVPLLILFTSTKTRDLRPHIYFPLSKQLKDQTKTKPSLYPVCWVPCGPNVLVSPPSLALRSREICVWEPANTLPLEVSYFSYGRQSDRRQCSQEQRTNGLKRCGNHAVITQITRHLPIHFFF